MAVSFSANLSCSAMWYTFDTWMSLDICSLMALINLGCVCPNPFTATPDRASKYFLPSLAHSQIPSPFSKVTGCLA